ncbi:hypothetical protein F4775DRAFT_187165 [Biscogniauxia sp. FL1348]|nr:hypothetical protein F4775DRAFT_187165 [Biscogniauxia sp. FL1348]
MMDRDEPRNSGLLAANPDGRGNSIPQPPSPANRLSAEKLSVATDFQENSSVVSDPDSTSGRSSKASQRGGTPKPSLIARPIPSPRPSPSPSPSPRFNRSVSSSSNLGSSRSPHTPRDTRIPRPKSTIPTSTPTTTPTLVKRITPGSRTSSQKGPSSEDMRQPMDMKAAFKLAQEQEPRSQPHSRPESSLSMRQAYNMAAAEANGRRGMDGSPSPAPRTDRRDSSIPRPKSTLSGRHSDLGHHLQQFDRNHQLTGGGGALNGLFTKIRGGAKTADGNRSVSRRTSSSSIGGRPEGRRTSFWGLSPRNKENSKSAGTTPKGRAVSRASSEAAIEDLRVPSLDYESASEGRSSPMMTPTHPSPDKSYNWHLDADFTAGELQVSDSPRVRIDKPSGGGSNGVTPDKSDKSARSDKSDRSGSPPPGTPYFRRINIRLEQIKEREAKAALEAANQNPKRGNSKLDEIRAREMEAESKKALAWSRLYDIRVQNGEARSNSPESSKSPKEDLRSGPLHFNKRRSMGGSMESSKSERPEIARSNPDPKVKEETPFEVVTKDPSSGKVTSAPEAKVDVPQPRDEDKHESLDNDSHDLLRRLARATSSSPLVEKAEKTEKVDRLTRSEELPPKPSFEPRNSSRRRHSTWEDRRSRNLDTKSSKEGPMVEPTGLRKVKSNDSIREKRGSRPVSEVDPTDRIEGEMKLFAPTDNPSERGSKRATSPIPTEPAEEVTPRPPKVDPRTLPTPRITGAYFDTPLTVKMQEKEDLMKETDLSGLQQAADIIAGAHNRNSSWSHAKHDVGHTTRDRTKTSDRSKPRSSSAPSTSRRARSRSRSRRRRPLINTAKPASVKDDIRAILRMNQIDDSTLEDFDSILNKHEIADEELEKMVNDSAFKAEEDLDFTGMTDRERELETYDRMSKTLKTGLLGIRSAKRGIERLEDKVTHAEHKEDQAEAQAQASVPASLNASPQKTAVRTHAKTAKPTAYTVKIPPLYRRTPQFKFTPFGLLTFIIAVWYALESIFCYLYAAPQYDCTPTMPCDWSPNEPYFPYTMPFMLDEWTTGGKGRAVAWRIGEEVGDVVADISDWITNTDFTQFDQKYMNVWERKRHRRRLRKHGMIPKWTEPPNYKPRYAEWHAARLAREEEFRYASDDETMSANARLR